MSIVINANERLAERMELHKNLPLGTPLTIQIWISDVCNFRCKYCVQAENAEIRSKHVSQRLMDFSVYRKIIDRIKEMGHLKKLMLFGNGEPLCHPEFANMVRYAKERDVADIVETFSNGALLTHSLSAKLVDSGLDRLKISLQGLSADSYKKIAGADIDYEKFVSEIRFFYENRKNCVLQIKIIENMVPTDSDKKMFHKIYAPICDELLIESLMELDWEQKRDKGGSHAVFGNERIHAQICPKPFFSLHIDTDGEVRPCCFAPAGFTFGDATKSLKNIWLGENYNCFLQSLLRGEGKPKACETCANYSYLMMASDVLDGHEKELLQRYQDNLLSVDQ